MQSLGRHLRILGASIAALAALVAVAAAPATAAEVNATFSGSSMKLTTAGVTIKKNGADPKTCTLLGGSTSGATAGNGVWVFNDIYGSTLFNCTGGTKFGVWTEFKATYDTVTGQYTLRSANVSPQGNPSPWGNYVGGNSLKGTWVNGSGGTPSTLTFNETTIGTITSSGHVITLSGTFNATTSSGGLLTLSH